MTWDCNNSCTIESLIGHWQFNFCDDQLISIRPIDSSQKIPVEEKHHTLWASHLNRFFESRGKIVPPYQAPKTGTPFQHRVWACLSEIPAGTTCTYQNIADILGTYPRPIGQACRVNPLPLFIPCHRVVAKSGLGGYMGPNQSGLQLKQQLLTLEQDAVNG